MLYAICDMPEAGIMKTSFEFTPAQRKLLYSWLVYAISTAGIAGTLAFAVAMTRTPGVRLLPSARAFQVILIGHVTYALTIWLLAFISTVWTYAAFRSGVALNLRAGWVGLAAALLGTGIITVPIVLFQGEAVTTDYVPLLDTPLFFIGFVTFLAGVGITAANYLASAWRHVRNGGTLSLTAYGMACAAVAALTAILALGVAALRLGVGANGRVPADYYQAMFWGMGHSLQYVSVAAMVVAWYAVVGLALGKNPDGAELTGGMRKLALGMFTLFAAFPLATPFPYFFFDPIAVPTKKIIGIALDGGLSLPVMFLGPMLLIWVWRSRTDGLFPWVRRMPWNDPRVMTFVFSAALFVLGLSIHPAARQGTLRTPAHYHSVVVGGVTLAFMGLAYHLLAKVNRPLAWRRVATAQPYLFAVGLMFLVIGLMGAGDLGAPRKTYDAAVTGVAWLKPMVVMGGGAAVAALGGALFVAIMLWSLLQKAERTQTVEIQQPVLAGSAGD
jgi:cytochrome c oxidase subunit 1